MLISRVFLGSEQFWQPYYRYCGTQSSRPRWSARGRGALFVDIRPTPGIVRRSRREAIRAASLIIDGDGRLLRPAHVLRGLVPKGVLRTIRMRRSQCAVNGTDRAAGHGGRGEQDNNECPHYLYLSPISEHSASSGRGC